MDQEETVAEIRKYVNKRYFDDIKWNLRSGSCWQFNSNIFEALGHILLGLGAILSFSTGFFDYMLLSFIAGCVTTSAMVCLKFSSYASGESSQRIDRANLICKELGIKDVVDTNDATDDTSDQNDMFNNYAVEAEV